jgi:carbamoyl-phosphate synthase large subunit
MRLEFSPAISVKLIGADVQAIQRGENRELFRGIVEKLEVSSAKSIICHTMDEVILAAVEILQLPM